MIDGLGPSKVWNAAEKRFNVVLYPLRVVCEMSVYVLLYMQLVTFC